MLSCYFCDAIRRCGGCSSVWSTCVSCTRLWGWEERKRRARRSSWDAAELVVLCLSECPVSGLTVWTLQERSVLQPILSTSHNVTALFQLQADPLVFWGMEVQWDRCLLSECGEENRVAVYPSWVWKDRVVKTREENWRAKKRCHWVKTKTQGRLGSGRHPTKAVWLTG